MLKLQGLSELSKIAEVPEAAFAPEPTITVPDGAFESRKKPNRGEYAAYVKYARNGTTTKEYSAFVFLKSTLRMHFKNFNSKDRYELIQGKAPHNDWFMLRKATVKRGNKVVQHGLVFYHPTVLNLKALDKEARYPLEMTFKDDALYVKLPAELVPLLR